MPDTLTTATEVIDALDVLPPDMPVGFVTETGEIGEGYHITELKLAEVRSIDCVGRRADWVEAQLQLLDGSGAGWQGAGKITAVLRRCFAALPDLAEAPLSVEFGHRNHGLSRFALGALELRGDRAVVPLLPAAAQCKPAAEIGGPGPTAGAGCCGPVATDAARDGCCN